MSVSAKLLGPGTWRILFLSASSCFPEACMRFQIFSFWYWCQLLSIWEELCFLNFLRFQPCRFLIYSYYRGARLLLLLAQMRNDLDSPAQLALRQSYLSTLLRLLQVLSHSQRVQDHYPKYSLLLFKRDLLNVEKCTIFQSIKL